MRVAARSRTRARGPAASEKMASMGGAARVSLSSWEAEAPWPEPLYMYLELSACVRPWRENGGGRGADRRSRGQRGSFEKYKKGRQKGQEKEEI